MVRKGGERVVESQKQRIVTDGPFTEEKEAITGFWIRKVASKAEAIEWEKRIPRPDRGTDTEVRICELFETSCRPES